MSNEEQREKDSNLTTMELAERLIEIMPANSDTVPTTDTPDAVNQLPLAVRKRLLRHELEKLTSLRSCAEQFYKELPREDCEQIAREERAITREAIKSVENVAVAYAKLRRAESEVVAAQKALLSAYDDAYEKVALAQSKWREVENEAREKAEMYCGETYAEEDERKEEERNGSSHSRLLDSSMKSNRIHAAYMDVLNSAQECKEKAAKREQEIVEQARQQMQQRTPLAFRTCGTSDYTISHLQRPSSMYPKSPSDDGERYVARKLRFDDNTIDTTYDTRAAALPPLAPRPTYAQDFETADHRMSFAFGRPQAPMSMEARRHMTMVPRDRQRPLQEHMSLLNLHGVEDEAPVFEEAGHSIEHLTICTPIERPYIHKFWSLKRLRQKVDYAVLDDTVRALNTYISRNGGMLPVKTAIKCIQQTHPSYSMQRAYDLLDALREMKLMHLQ